MAKTKPRQSAKSPKVTSTTILEPNYFVTGVRGLAGSDVVLTGSAVTGGVQNPLLYIGPISPTDRDGIHVLVPEISGQQITGATFYGPDTPLFNPAIGKGNVRAVGSYQYSGSEARNHGLYYEGPPSGGGTWQQIDVPSQLFPGRTVWNTIAHSTMGDLVVGNYDLMHDGTPVPFSGNAFIYNIRTRRWTIFDLGGAASLTTAYGLWQIERGGTQYVIAGGTRDGHGLNKGMLIDYDAATGAFGNLTLYSALNVPSLLTHFEGITAVPGGYHLAAATIRDAAVFCSVKVDADGAFGAARWIAYEYPGSALTTGNTIYRDTMMGIYAVSGTDGVQSYAAAFELR